MNAFEFVPPHLDHLHDAQVLAFYNAQFEQLPPVALGLTLGGITVGLLALRFLRKKDTHVVFPSIALVTAFMALGCVFGHVSVHTPLKVAFVGVLYLMWQESGNIMLSVINFIIFGVEGVQHLHKAARSRYSEYRTRKTAKPTPSTPALANG